MPSRDLEQGSRALYGLFEALGYPQQLLFQDAVRKRMVLEAKAGIQETEMPEGRPTGLDFIQAVTPRGFVGRHPSIAAALGVGSDFLADPLLGAGFARGLMGHMGAVGAVRLPRGSLSPKTLEVLKRLGYEPPATVAQRARTAVEALQSRKSGGRAPFKETAVEAAEEVLPAPPKAGTADMTPGKLGRLEAATRAEGLPGIGDTATYIDDAGRQRNFHVTNYNPNRGTYVGVDLRTGSQVITNADKIVAGELSTPTGVERSIYKDRAPRQTDVVKRTVYDPDSGQMRVVTEEKRTLPPTATAEPSLAEQLGAPNLKEVRKPGPLAERSQVTAKQPARSIGFMGSTPDVPKRPPAPTGFVVNDRVSVGGKQGVVRRVHGDMVSVDIGKGRTVELPSNLVDRMTPEEYWKGQHRTLTQADVQREAARIESERAARVAREDVAAAKKAAGGAAAKPAGKPVMSPKQELEQARATAEALNANQVAHRTAPAVGHTVTWLDDAGREQSGRVTGFNKETNLAQVKPYGSKETVEFPQDRLTVKEKEVVPSGKGAPAQELFRDERGAVGRDIRNRGSSNDVVEYEYAPGKIGAATVPTGQTPATIKVFTDEGLATVPFEPRNVKRTVRSGLQNERGAVGWNIGDRDKAFEELAHSQRGLPEVAMGKVQEAYGGGVLNGVVEHVGDLTHRMSTQPQYNTYRGYENTREKVEKTLRWLTNKYGFEREMEENILSNARHRNVPDTQVRKAVHDGLRTYAEEHAKLPVYNEAQWNAREAAVAIGRMNFQKAIRHLEALKNELDKGRDHWGRFAGEFDPAFVPQAEKTTQPWEKYLKDERGAMSPTMAGALGLGAAGAILGVRKLAKDAATSRERRQRALDEAARQ